ncbi:methylglyoxal synthase [Paenibacillus sp. L3-i20]|nr:methylglyoxal synthase [Paenibacillus sp. L3-i20]
MNVAFVAHDNKKDEMIQFTIAYQSLFQAHTLFATGTTGRLIMENTTLPIVRFMSGPLGGDQQIGSMVASNELDLLLFFRDPLVSQPHEPDITALLRLCDVYGIPVATNMATAELLVHSLQRGDLNWRELIHQCRPTNIAHRKLKPTDFKPTEQIKYDVDVTNLPIAESQ